MLAQFVDLEARLATLGRTPLDTLDARSVKLSASSGQATYFIAENAAKESK